MHCQGCGFDNPPGMRFCGRCGGPLNSGCPQCGFANPPGFAFCGQCATPLPARAPARDPVPPDRRRPVRVDLGAAVMPASGPRATSAAERRQLTVMFCDLVDSTPLSEQLDPEDLREVVHAYQEACAEVISRFDGYLAKYLGDGLLVYFGYPLAHEDDARRAVRTGLGILAAMKPLNRRLQEQWGIRLGVRVGVHTGLVVAGEMGGGETREAFAIVGRTPNVAARLQGAAEPDTVVISAYTDRLVRGFFACRPLGPHALRGVAEPVEVYRVLHESGAESRLDVALTTGLTPLVGREQEAALLQERWQRAQAGTGQVVLLGGEAGIGKSRLLHALKEHTAGEAHARWEYRCSPYHQHSALYPVVGAVQRALRLASDDSSEGKLDKLERALNRAGVAVPEAAPLIAALLSLPAARRYPPLTLTPERQKQQTLDALLTWLLQEAERGPLLVIVEDLHWSDPSTLEFLSLLIDRAATARMFTLLTSRPDFSPPWTGRPHLTHITLDRLTRQQVRDMVARLTGGKALPAAVLEQVVTRTDGVPLFVEELVKEVLESGLVREDVSGYQLTRPLPPLGIPATLQDSLMARLDRLTTAREVAQLAAVLGREFPYALLRAVSPHDEATLRRELARLVEAELLYLRGLPAEATYSFKHALIQEAAYQSLLRSRRQEYHARVAQSLEEGFPETVETQPEILAHHYTEAGNAERAIISWHRASRRAVARSAHLEAIGHLTRALELLAAFPDTPDRARQELALQVALGTPLTAAKGFAAPEVERAYARARELCLQVGDTPQLFAVLVRLATLYLSRTDYTAARALSEQCLELAEAAQYPAFLLAAHTGLGQTLYMMGELLPARAHLERAIALYDPRKHGPLSAMHPAGVGALCFVAWVLWECGYPDQGMARINQALCVAEQLAEPFNLALALNAAALLHQLRREGPAAQARAEATIRLASEHGFPVPLAGGTAWRGWALAAQGRVEEGIAQMRRSLDLERAAGQQALRTQILALLAEAQGKAGQAAEGLRLAAEGLELVDKSRGGYREAELYRVKGELLLALSAEDQAQAENCLRRAIEIARRQSAKSWELRAAISLARLWQSQGRTEAARELLAGIYGWFDEGLDTADLHAARALLGGLTEAAHPAPG